MKLLFKKIRPFIIPVIATLTIVILFHSIFFLGYVPTESMEPTLETGCLILGFRYFDDLQNGDIIIFKHDGSYLVKRIAASSGETVMHQNELVIVPKDSFFVLGDNADNSLDSRHWEEPFVSLDDVMAKLLLPLE